MSDDLLKKVDPSRRGFLKALLAGAAFVTPTLLSFSMNGYGVGRRKARADSGNSVYGPSSGNYCPSTDPGSNKDVTIALDIEGAINGPDGPVNVVCHVTDVYYSQFHNMRVQTPRGNFLAKCFWGAFDISGAPASYMVSGDAGGALDHEDAICAFTFNINGDDAVGRLIVFHFDGNDYTTDMDVEGPLDRGSFKITRK